MKTLHKIFHQQLLRDYLLLVVVTVACLVIAMMTTKIDDAQAVMGILHLLTYLFAALGPMMILGLHPQFFYNIHFLINQHFNRWDLIKFFFLSQTLRVFLFGLNYFLLGLVWNGLSDNKIRIIAIPKIDLLFSTFFIFFVAFFSAIFILYFMLLSTANYHELLRQQMAKKASEKSNKHSKKNKSLGHKMLALGLAFILITLFEAFSRDALPAVLIALLWCAFVAMMSQLIINRTFKISPPKKAFLRASVGSVILCIPLMVIIWCMRGEGHNNNLGYSQKANSVIFLNWLNSPFSEEEMLGFLKEVNGKDYKELLTLFGDQVDFDSSLAMLDNQEKAKYFIDFHSRVYSQEKVQKIVTHMAQLMHDKEFNFRFAQYSQSFFIVQKVDPIYIEELIRSKSPYKQLAALYFARNVFDKNQFQEFYNSHTPLLDRDVIDDQYLKRAIADKYKSKN